MSDTTWYDVYTLIDPFDMKAFYVGITDDLVRRYIDHIKMTDTNEAKNAKVASIIARGCLPLMSRLMSIQGKTGAFEMEALLIEICRIYKQPLTNRELRMYENIPSRQAILDTAIETVRQAPPGCELVFGLVDQFKLREELKALGYEERTINSNH